VIAESTSAVESAKTSPVSVRVAIVCSRASAVLEPHASVTKTGHRLRSKACLTVGAIPTSRAMPAMMKESRCASLIARLRNVPSNPDIVNLPVTPSPSRGASSGTICQPSEPWRKKGFVSSGLLFRCQTMARRNWPNAREGIRQEKVASEKDSIPARARGFQEPAAEHSDFASGTNLRDNALLHVINDDGAARWRTHFSELIGYREPISFCHCLSLMPLDQAFYRKADSGQRPGGRALQ